MFTVSQRFHAAMNEQLTKDFKLSEFLVSPGAKDKFNHLSSDDKAMVYGNIIVLAKRLQKLRDTLGCPFHITSGYRTPQRNHGIKGAASHSTHLDGRGCDLVVPAEFTDRLNTLSQTWEGGYKYYPDQHFHFDIRPFKARW
jgi:uncharacterized protein YcbK (DUF882 family)